MVFNVKKEKSGFRKSIAMYKKKRKKKRNKEKKIGKSLPKDIVKVSKNFRKSREDLASVIIDKWMQTWENAFVKKETI